MDRAGLKNFSSSLMTCSIQHGWIIDRFKIEYIAYTYVFVVLIGR